MTAEQRATAAPSPLTDDAATLLAAADVSYAYDETVLSDVSLTVDAGEVVAVIGPSGVGKTTLLRLLVLFERPDDGTVTFDGVDAWAVDDAERLALRRRIGVVFQEANLFDAPVRRNVAYGLRVRRPWSDRVRDELAALAARTAATAGQLGRLLRVRRPAVDVGRRLVPAHVRERAAAAVARPVPGRVDEALSVVGLADDLDVHATELSGGEAQRVSFARALAYDPDVLLLDEPTSDLDPRNTAVIEDAITEARDRDIGVVVATHDMHQARRIADRVAVLLDGTVLESGPTDAIFEDPADERTRKFVEGELVY